MRRWPPETGRWGETINLAPPSRWALLCPTPCQAAQKPYMGSWQACSFNGTSAKNDWPGTVTWETEALQLEGPEIAEVARPLGIDEQLRSGSRWRQRRADGRPLSDQVAPRPVR